MLVELLDGLNLLFELHSSILKPDFDLSLGQAKLVCHFDPSSPREVVIRMELLFQLQSLVTGVSLTASSPEAISPREQMCTTRDGHPRIKGLVCRLLKLRLSLRTSEAARVHPPVTSLSRGRINSRRCVPRHLRCAHHGPHTIG